MFNLGFVRERERSDIPFGLDHGDQTKITTSMDSIMERVVYTQSRERRWTSRRLSDFGRILIRRGIAPRLLCLGKPRQ